MNHLVILNFPAILALIFNIFCHNNYHYHLKKKTRRFVFVFNFRTIYTTRCKVRWKISGHIIGEIVGCSHPNFTLFTHEVLNKQVWIIQNSNKKFLLQVCNWIDYSLYSVMFVWARLGICHEHDTPWLLLLWKEQDLKHKIYSRQ